MKNSKENNILQFSSIQTTELITLSKKNPQLIKKQCRICLQEDNEQRKQMLSPCKCIGSVECVHNICLEKWIYKSLKLPNLTLHQIKTTTFTSKCQMCKYPIPYNIQIDDQVKCSTVLQKIRNRKLFALLFVFYTIGLITCLCFLIIYAIRKNLNFTEANMVESCIISGFCIISILLFLSGVIIFGNNFLFERNIKVKLVKPNTRYHGENTNVNSFIVVEQLY